jgi:hypothetical protein
MKMALHFTITEATEDQLRKAETDLCVQKRYESDYRERAKLAARINAIRAELRRRVSA